MLKHLIVKEIADHMQKLRFLLTGSVLVIIFAVSSLAFVSEYSRIVEDYKTPEQRAARLVNLTNPMLAMVVQLPIYVQEKPNPLWFCVNGGSYVLPNLFRVDQLWNLEIKTSYYRSRENPWILKLGALDWVFLTGFILSFMAIVLSYDSFSGEKEEGTLSLMLSNHVPRFKVLLGKFAGIFLVILFPLVIGQILSLIIIQSSSSIIFESGDWGRIGAVILLSWMCLSVFIWIGLIVSSRTHNSSTSIVVLLFIWVMITIIIPGTSCLVSRIVYHLPRKEIVEEQYTRMYDAAVKESFKKDYSKIEKAQIQIKALHEAAAIRDDYRQKKFTQVETARLFARISPMSAFEYAAAALAGTGLSHHKNILEQLKSYRENVGDFLLSEERRVSDDPQGLLFYTTMPWIEFNSKALPIFQENPIGFRHGLKKALLDIGFLALYGILFFACAYVSFNRYDVR